MPKGYKTPKTIEKEQAGEIITESLKELLDAQI